MIARCNKFGVTGFPKKILNNIQSILPKHNEKFHNFHQNQEITWNGQGCICIFWLLWKRQWRVGENKPSYGGWNWFCIYSSTKESSKYNQGKQKSMSKNELHKKFTPTAPNGKFHYPLDFNYSSSLARKLLPFLTWLLQFEQKTVQAPRNRNGYMSDLLKIRFTI